MLQHRDFVPQLTKAAALPVAGRARIVRSRPGRRQSLDRGQRDSGHQRRDGGAAQYLEPLRGRFARPIAGDQRRFAQLLAPVHSSLVRSG